MLAMNILHTGKRNMPKLVLQALGTRFRGSYTLAKRYRHRTLSRGGCSGKAERQERGYRFVKCCFKWQIRLST